MANIKADLYRRAQNLIVILNEGISQSFDDLEKYNQHLEATIDQLKFILQLYADYINRSGENLFSTYDFLAVNGLIREIEDFLKSGNDKEMFDIRVQTYIMGVWIRTIHNSAEMEEDMIDTLITTPPEEVKFPPLESSLDYFKRRMTIYNILLKKYFGQNKSFEKLVGKTIISDDKNELDLIKNLCYYCQLIPEIKTKGRMFEIKIIGLDESE